MGIWDRTYDFKGVIGSMVLLAKRRGKDVGVSRALISSALYCTWLDFIPIHLERKREVLTLNHHTIR